MSVSVVVVTYNRKELLQRTLQSLSRQTYPAGEFEVIVVDDGSTDGTADAVKGREWPFRCRYHYQENRGLGPSRNWAAAQSDAEQIAFLDDDIVVNESYLQALLSAEWNRRPLMVAGTLRPPAEMLTSPFHDHYIRRSGASPAPEAASAQVAIPFYDCTGGALMMRREHFLALGGMQALPEGGGTSWGGLDLAYRALQAGFAFYRRHDAIAVHYDYAIQDLQTYSERMVRVGRYAVVLLQKYPELASLVPLFRDRDFVRPGVDPIPIALRKSWRSLMALPLTMAGMDRCIRFLEQNQVSRALLRRLYIWYVSSSFTQGVRQGVREFGAW